jgi:hypothetical protein
MLEKANTIQTHDSKSKIQLFSLHLEEQRASGREKKTRFPNMTLRLLCASPSEQIISVIMLENFNREREPSTSSAFIYDHNMVGHCEKEARRKDESKFNLSSLRQSNFALSSKDEDTVVSRPKQHRYLG